MEMGLSTFWTLVRLLGFCPAADLLDCEIEILVTEMRNQVVCDSRLRISSIRAELFLIMPKSVSVGSAGLPESSFL